MANTQPITVSEMTQTPVIMKMVNRISSPLSMFQQFFGKMRGDNGAATQRVSGRACGWDIVDSTRTIAGASAPMTGPRKIKKRVIGHQTAQLMRFHESIEIFDEEIFNQRDIGGRIGQVLDLAGQNKVRMQIDYVTQRYNNQREWIYSRMLRGGFNMVPVNNGHFTLDEYNTGAADEIPINFQIPAEHLTGLDMGTGTDIMDNWSDPTNDIVGQCYKINKAMTRIHGRPLRHIFLNSTTMQYVQNNTNVKAVGGDAFTVFNYLSPRQITSKEGIPDAGFDVVFRAMPLFRFHVYDGVMSADGETEGIATSDTSLLIPDDYAIFLPEPDDWDGLITGSEPVRPTVTSQSVIASGFYPWSTPFIDPPGREVKFLDNYLPVLYNPRCVAYGYVKT